VELNQRSRKVRFCAYWCTSTQYVCASRNVKCLFKFFVVVVVISM
jgi:hypothetical protein